MFSQKKCAVSIRPHSVVSCALSIVVSVTLMACGSGSSDGSGNGAPSQSTVVLTPPAIEIAARATYAVVFVNAQDGKRITDPLTVTFTGEAPLVDYENKPLNGSTITTSDGQIALGAQFTAAKTDFSVLAGNPAIGWANTGTRIVGSTATVGDQTILLKMLNTKNAAAITADPTVAISAKVTEVLNFNTATTVAAVNKMVVNDEGKEEMAGGAVLTIPAGSKAVDPKTGAVVATTGALTVSTTKFSNSESNALAAFPGGFAASVTVPPTASFTVNPTAGSSGETGAFITGGFAQFNVTDSTGKALTEFDKPLALSIDLPKSSLGQDGEPIVVGSKYPVWSFNDANGSWTFEKEGIVREKSPVDPSNFTVDFESNHLSSWNLDFYIPRARTCRAVIRLDRGTDTRPLSAQVVGAPGQRFGHIVSNVRDSEITVFNVPTTLVGTVKVYDGVNQVGSATRRLCASGFTGIPLNLSPIVPASKGTLIVEVTKSCPDLTNRRAFPSMVLYSKGSQGGPYESKGTTTSGNKAQAVFFNKDAGIAEVTISGLPFPFRFPDQTVSIPGNSSVTVSFNSPTLNCATVTGGTGG